MKYLLFALLAPWVFLSTLIIAATNDELELEGLNQIEAELTLQREWAEYRWKKTNSECYAKFFVNSCLADARAKYRREIDPIRAQEVLLNENQRIFKDRIKTQRDAQRAAERADPKRSQERADNEKAFQQKQLSRISSSTVYRVIQVK